jgi:hypothetical protein
MKSIPPRIWELALRLIEYERGKQGRRKSASKKPSKRPAPLADTSENTREDFAGDFSALEKLRAPLITLMSNLGFQALLMRARTLAVVNAPWLSELTVYSDGSIGGRTKNSKKIDPEVMRAGSHLLLAHVLTLLEAFIGEVLTLQLVSEVWPKVPLDDLDSGRGVNLEKAT